MTDYQIDLTGRPARHDGALRGRRISWRALATIMADRHTARDGAVRAMVRVAPHQYVNSATAARLGLPGSVAYAIDADRPSRDAKPATKDRLDTRAHSYLPDTATAPHTAPPAREKQHMVQSTVKHTAACVRPPVARAAPMAANDNAPVSIMAPLRAVPAAPPKSVARSDSTQSAGRVPFLEERQAGRVDDRHWAAAGWYLKQDEVASSCPTGLRRNRESGAVGTPFVSRDPAALWGQEVAADFALKQCKLADMLGPFVRIVERALREAAEMAELAPAAIPVPQRKKAEAGRLRLGAGLEIIARLQEAEAENRQLAKWEVTEIAMEAANKCWDMASTRRMRAANDNKPASLTKAVA